MMLLVPLTRGHYALMVAVFVVWGIAGFGMMSPQQSRLAALAPAQAPHPAVAEHLDAVHRHRARRGDRRAGLAAGSGFDHLAWVGVPFALLGWLDAARSVPTRSAALRTA